MVEELPVFLDHPIQVVLSQDQQMIEAFSPYAAEEAFADRVGFRRAVRRFQDFNPTADCHLGEGSAIFAIAVPDQVTWG